MIKDTLTKLIDAHQSAIKDWPRNYIGASSIGSECLRQIWYEYKGYPSEGISTKTRRTWDIGNRLEGLVIEWLEKAGLQIDTKFPSLMSSNWHPFKGNIDGVLLSGVDGCNDWAIIEIKTAKDASFRIFKGKGLKLWNPQYYAQVQSYMGMSGIHKAYILVLNKDNSDLSDELVEFNEEHYRMLEDKAAMIARADLPPPRISSSPLWYKCKLCKFNKVCHV